MERYSKLNVTLPIPILTFFIDPIAIVSSMRSIVSAMSSLLVLDDVVNSLVSIVRVSSLSRFDLVSARGCGSGGGVTHSVARIVAVECVHQPRSNPSHELSHKVLQEIGDPMLGGDGIVQD